MLDTPNPQSLESEQAVLGCLLISGSALHQIIFRLQPEDFVSAGHRRIYDAMLMIQGRSEPVDVLTVAAELELAGNLAVCGGPAYLNALCDAVPTAAHSEYYASIVEDRSVRRSLAALAREFVQRLSGGEDAAVQLADSLCTDAMKLISQRLRRLEGKWMDELCEENYPEAEWAVPGVISMGLSLLVSPPKSGKSWLALQAALSIAAGGICWSRYQVRQGPVLLLFREDTEQRLQSRVRMLMQDTPCPRGLMTYPATVSIPSLETGGYSWLYDQINRLEGCRLVIIDTLQRFRSHVENNHNVYAADYEAVGKLKTIADTTGVPILCLHHTRKGRSDDFVEAVSGTSGITGAADSVLKLTRIRGEDRAKLELTGRDLADTEDLALSWSPTGWTCHGPAALYGQTQSQEEIFAILREEATSQVTTTDLYELVDASPTAIRSRLCRLRKQGFIERHRNGSWSLVKPDQTEPDPRLKD